MIYLPEDYDVPHPPLGTQLSVAAFVAGLTA